MSTGRARRTPAAALVVGAIGVVYGDLGTSPLYSIREAFEGSSHRLAVDETNVLGAISIIVWTLTLIVTVKYVILMLRADNNGEGGILSLTALISGPDSLRVDQRVRTGGLILLGLFGTALLFGDGMITPAISVLSAVEGVEVVRPGLAPAVVPVSVAILVALFSIQRFGTGGVGRVFGPIMVVWFLTIGVLGLSSVAQTPRVLTAINPTYAVQYFADNGWKAFLSMGSLFLVVTGGEALYADMGHFGRRPIRQGWFVLVMPALLITYMGIGALLLRDPEAIRSPFFLLAPESLRLALVVLATAATVIASQALITGVFSLTSQAVHLGFAPRTRIVYTSARARGQIYVPVINWALMAACVGLVVGFGSSSRLAAAFGLSVTGTMFITTILFAVFARRNWGWSPITVVVVCGVLLVVEGAFLLANMFKIPDGGWFPLVVAAVILVLFTTWKTGRNLVAGRIAGSRTPLQTFVSSVAAGEVARVEGTAVFLYSQRETTPPSMAALVRATGTLHEDVHVVAVVIDEVPHVHPVARAVTEDLGHGVHRVTLRYGFMEPTRVADDLERHLSIHPDSTDFVVGREAVRSTARPGMARWREALYGVMVRNASDVAAWFHLPAERVLEVGTRVEI